MLLNLHYEIHCLICICLKLVTVFKPLLKRDIIKESFIPKSFEVTELFGEELDRCKHLFDAHLEQVR